MRLPAGWDADQDKADWEQVKALLEKLRNVQQETETIAHSQLEQPALTLAREECEIGGGADEWRPHRHGE